MLLSQESQKMRQVVLLVSFVLSVAAENSAQSSIKKTKLSREGKLYAINTFTFKRITHRWITSGSTANYEIIGKFRELTKYFYQYTIEILDPFATIPRSAIRKQTPK